MRTVPGPAPRTAADVESLLRSLQGTDGVAVSVDTVTSVLTAAPVVFIVLLTVYYTYRELKDVRRTGSVFLRVVSHDQKGKILDEIEYLLNLPDEKIKTTSEKLDIIRSTYTTSLNRLIKEYTEDLEERQELSIYDDGAEARFYTDFQEASIASNDDLEKLAEILSVQIIEDCEEYMAGEVDQIAALGDGNIVLANEVSEYLELPLLIAGNVRGGNVRDGEDTIVGDYSSGDQVIIVDDIGFSGTMMTKALRALHREGLGCVDVHVLLKRDNRCDYKVAKFCEENDVPGISVNACRELIDDDEVAEIVKG